MPLLLKGEENEDRDSQCQSYSKACNAGMQFGCVQISYRIDYVVYRENKLAAIHIPRVQCTIKQVVLDSFSNIICRFTTGRSSQYRLAA